MLYVAGFLLYCSFLFSSIFEQSGCAAEPQLKKEVAGQVVSVSGKVFIRPDQSKSNRTPISARPGDEVRTGDVINTSSDGGVKLLLKDKSLIDLGPSVLFKVDQYKNNQGADRQADFNMMYGKLRAVVSQKIEGKGRFKIRTPAATMGVRGTEFVIKTELRSLAEIRHAVKHPGQPMPKPPVPSEVGEAPSSIGKESGDKQANASQELSKPKAPETSQTEITVIQGEVEVKKETPKALPKAESSRRDLAEVVPPKEDKVISLKAGAQLTTSQAETAPIKPVQLDVTQLKAITQEAKVVDNTFQKAVVIEAVAPSGDPSVFASGEVTKAALSAVMNVPVVPPVSISDMGISGTFGVVSTFAQQPMSYQPQYKSLRVRVVYK